MSLYLDFPLAENAAWIWVSSISEPNSYAEFRRTIDIQSMPAEAWIQLSAETSLRLWINGRLLHSGPLREVAPYFYFDTVDLRPHLRVGHNEICLQAHHQGANSQSYQAGTAAILVAGRCVTEGEEPIDFAHLPSWQSRRLTRYRADAHRLFSCIGFSEHVDFDAPEEPWNPVVEVARHPWNERPRALVRDLSAFTETVREASSFTARDGGWLIDFGTEVSGYIQLTLKAKQPTTVRVAYAEALEQGEVCPTKGGMAYYDVLELPLREIVWRSYEKRAFRYLQLSGPVESVQARVIEQTYPYIPVYTQTASYQDNKLSEKGRLINRIFDVSARTLELNSEDLLTDCPWRERAQYFDSYFYMEAMHRLFGTMEPVRRFLNQFSRGADETGLLRMCYPSPKSTMTIPDFSISYAIQLLRYFELSGDRETMQRNLPFALRGVTAFEANEGKNGLLIDVPGWIFLDNTFELPKFPRSAALNAVYYGGHCALASLLHTCGQEEPAASFEKKARRIRDAFRRTFVCADRVLDSDSTPDHEAFCHWVYHHSAESGHWQGKSFRLRTSFQIHKPHQSLRVAVHAGARVWIDGQLIAEIKEGGSWTRSAFFQPVELATPADDHWHQLDLEIQWNAIDWECYLSCASQVTWKPILIWEEPEFGSCQPETEPPLTAFTSCLRNHIMPWMSQITVGHAAFHGLLEAEEARRFLKDCLPERYSFPFAKRTTPFFAHIDDRPDPRRILPCNVPSSLYHFCHALRRYGMESEARNLLLLIYRGMLERGATTWWEEWNTRSSLCHVWSTFGVTFLDA